MAHSLTAALVITGMLCSASPSFAGDDLQPAVPQGHHFFNAQALGLLVRRISVSYELQPATHHSLTISSWMQYPGNPGTGVAEGGVFGVGSELGYRYYAGAPGPSGPFCGASLIGGVYISKYTFYETAGEQTPYAHYGVAMDMGYAFHIDRTITSVVGVGAQRTWVDIDANEITPYGRLVVGEGVRPRLFLQVGRIW